MAVVLVHHGQDSSWLEILYTCITKANHVLILIMYCNCYYRIDMILTANTYSWVHLQHDHSV